MKSKRLSRILKRLSKILKSDYIGTIVLAVILFVGVFAIWFGLRFAFQSDFPLLAVASGSMEQFLYRGDLIIVQGGLNSTELNAAPKDAQIPGEVIVFYDPRYDKVPIFLPVAGTETHLIVHRAISKAQNNDTWYFETKGDNNFGSDRWYGSETWEGKISEKLLVGKVVGKVPWLGHIPLFMHENPILVALIIGFLFAILFIADFIFPKKEDEKAKGKEEKLLSLTIRESRVLKNC